ncbi:phage minor head protein [Desulfobacter vibrioformis]|uniref:phage head morphogenesis protein n=1 Tax=Desulfobacter vibrioformis TaxID=34031 RepID=UPI00068D1119|nr:phage minor head protein [Desulfobacter vibrioformis]
MGFEFGKYPPKDALAYWQSKVPVTAREYYDLAGHARATAFTVSGLARMDQVQAVYDSLGKALADGQAFGAWKEDVLKKLPAGWEDKGFHLETIYRTNMQTAYQTGRYKQMMATVKTRPFWRYSAIKDKRTRPIHALLHGKVKRADDPFWDTFYPPNGHRCRCTVTSLSQREMDRKGLKEDTYLKKGALVEPVDPKTGNKMPARPLMPDNNFAGNTAKSFWEPDFGKYSKPIGDAGKAAIDKVTGKAALGVKTRTDMVGAIKDKLAPLSRKGIKQVEFISAGYLMATDGQGGITISTREFAGIGMTPSRDLLNAFKKLGTPDKLTFNEEYALESLWHEIQHNNQKIGSYVKGDYRCTLLETVNQWVSRRTYQRMMDQLGGYKPVHAKKVKTDGYGYAKYLRRFDALLERLGLDDMELLAQMEQIHLKKNTDDYAVFVSQLMAERSGKDKALLKACLKNLGNPEDFEKCLGGI